MEPVLLILVFMGVIAITALLFGGWVVFSLIRLVFRGLAAIVAPAQPRMPQMAQHATPAIGYRCANPKCRHVNPAVAQFCRRCGAGLPTVQRVATRRVAMW